MPVTHYLITDAAPAEIEAKTGLRGHMTPFGTLVEKPKPVDMHGALRAIERALNPNACTCGGYAIVHRPNCPAWNVMT